MLRATRMLEVIERDRLVEHADRMGRRLLRGLEAMVDRYGGLVSAPRGRGLMCAFDLPTTEIRDRTVRRCLKNGLIVLPCGTDSVRFRPALTISESEIDEALERLDGTLGRLDGEYGPDERATWEI